LIFLFEAVFRVVVFLKFMGRKVPAKPPLASMLLLRLKNRVGKPLLSMQNMPWIQNMRAA
jgi:hypothetical protein